MSTNEKRVTLSLEKIEECDEFALSTSANGAVSNKESSGKEYVAKSVPIDDDSSDILCICYGYAWRPRVRCITFTCVLILLILILALVDLSKNDVIVVPTTAPTVTSEIAEYEEVPSEMPSEATDMPTAAIIVTLSPTLPPTTVSPPTMVPITAPVAMPAFSLSPTNGVTDIGMPSVDPVDTVAPTSLETDVPTSSSTTKSPFGDIPIVTDMPTSSTTALTPTSLSPTPQPTNSPTEPSFTLTLSGDVISDAAPPGSQFGYTLSLSHNGGMLSVGSPNYEDKGMVRAYSLSSDQWQQLGPDLYGDNTDDWYGWATTLSANGLVMATSGGLGGGDTVPYVRVYNNVSPDGWSPRGGDLAGDFGFGNSISLSADGGRIAVGAKNIVSVFEYDEESDKWDLIGILKEKYASVALCENGDVLAVGGPYSNDVYDEGGVVKVWEYEGGESWVLRGGAAAMYGNDAMVRFGYSVSISNDGGIVAAGSLEGNYVKVSQFSDGSWMPYGEDIQGEEDDNDKFGFKVALSGDAERLVVGSPLYMNYNGRSVVYNFNNKEQTWDNVMDVVGTNRNDQEGYAVAMSSDGSSIASSAMTANNGAGRVRVFNLQ